MIDLNKNKEETLKNIYQDNWGKWLRLYPILENEDVINWLSDMVDQFTQEGKPAEKFQLQTSAKYLQQYCDHYQCKNPSELLKEDIDDRNTRLKNYLQFLYEGDIQEVKKLGFRKRPNDTSIRNQIQGKIKGFYSNRGANISYGLKARKTGINVDEIYVDREIMKMIQAKLESADYRLINKFESQCGLRINDVLETLTNGKYKIEKYKDHYFIRNFKTEKESVTINYLFLTEELAQLLQSIHPECDLTKLKLNKLFITRRGNRISQNDYLRRLKAIVEELGLEGNIKTHGMRKYFTTQLGEVNVDGKFKWHLEGREPNYRDAVYDNNLKNIEYFYQNWLKVEKLVCVDCVIVDKTSEEIAKLKVESAKKDDVINALAKRLAKAEQTLENVSDIAQSKEFIEFLQKIKKN